MTARAKARYESSYASWRKKGFGHAMAHRKAMRDARR